MGLDELLTLCGHLKLKFEPWFHFFICLSQKLNKLLFQLNVFLIHGIFNKLIKKFTVVRINQGQRGGSVRKDWETFKTILQDWEEHGYLLVLGLTESLNFLYNKVYDFWNRFHILLFLVLEEDRFGELLVNVFSLENCP